MVIRRVAIAVAATAGVLFATANPAHADDDLAVTVARVTTGQVQLVAAIPGASDTRVPEASVSWNGYLLPSTVQVGPATVVPDAETRTVVVVLDTSATMTDGSLRAAADAVLAFADNAPADLAIGLVTAADKPAVLLHPTRDRPALRAELAGLSAKGGIAIYDGLRTAAKLGGEAQNRRLLVVAASRDTAAGAESVVRNVKAARQRVDLVTLGAARSGLGQLRNLVATTGGTVRPVANPGALTDVLRSCATTFPPLVGITVAVPPEMAGTAGTLTVTAGRASAQVDVTFASGPAASASAASNPGPAPRQRWPNSDQWLLALLVFGTLLLAILLTLSGLGVSPRERRLRQVEQFRLAGRGPRVSGQTLPSLPEGGFAQTILGRLSERVLRSRESDERVARQLDRAGMTLRPGEWMAWRTGAAIFSGVVLGLLGGILGVLLGAALGWLAGGVYRRMLESRRTQAFADQLPDALQLIVGSLRSGFSLAQAIDAVIQDSPPGPLTVELSRAMGEVRLGSDLDVALERAAERVENDDLAWAVMAIRVQRDTGGNLAEVLETTVETLRERERLRRHVRALSAEGRLSAYILVGLPFALAAWLLLTRRDYISLLWTTRSGLVMLIGAAVLMALGAFWMARWLRVEV